MKKISILALLSFLLVCCNYHAIDSIELPMLDKSTVDNRSIDDAISIANQMIAGVATRNQSNNLNLITHTHVITSINSRSGATDTLMYALDILENQGFILIAAPKNIEPVMAYVDNGSFEDPQNIENEAYQMVLSEIKDEILLQSMGGTGPERDDTLKLSLFPLFYYDTVDIEVVRPPFVQVAWNQAWPENIFCPNKVAGCVPVAIAQILSAFELPKSINYTFPGRDKDFENINWSDIKKHQRSMMIMSTSSYDITYNCRNCENRYDEEFHKTIGRIVREIGHRCSANYEDYFLNGEHIIQTGVIAEKIIPTIKDMSGLNYTQQATNNLLLDYNLRDNDGAAIVWKNGHAWIADGIIYVDYWVCRKEYDPVLKIYIETETISIQKNLIHYNWGWGGNCNGYFRYPTTNSLEAEEYDYPYDSNKSSFDGGTDAINYVFYKK